MFRHKTARLRMLGVGLVLLAYPLLFPSAVLAQQSGIAGVVRDTSGAVLPGVTVEASSPALIEKVRTVVTDGQGRYNIVDLRPGTYTVVFVLPGFATVRREGIEMSTAFTATVNAEMRVGGLEETITVSGAAPMVDTQNLIQQNVVAREMLDSLPSAQRSMAMLANLTPGMVGNPDVGGTAGTYSQQAQVAGFRGKLNHNRFAYDGMRVSNMHGVASMSYIINGATLEEMSVETSGFTAESNSSGVLMKAIPKEGGNQFSGMFNVMYTNDSLQSSNINDELRSRGITTGFDIYRMYHTDAVLGGPIARDRLWFFTAHRWTGTRNQIGGIYWNATQGTHLFTPDLSRPADQKEDMHSHALRLTWQASQRNKVNVFVDPQVNKMPRHRRSGTQFNAPETLPFWDFSRGGHGDTKIPMGLYQATWSSPVTGRLLLEAGASAMWMPWAAKPQDGVDITRDISILEQSNNFRFNAAGGAGAYGDRRHSTRLGQRFLVSYVPGSHHFKTGIQVEQGIRDDGFYNSGFLPMDYTFLNGRPTGLNMFATPYFTRQRIVDMGIFAQDQWTIDRLTLSMGLRFDYFNGWVPAKDVPATPFLPARSFDAIHDVPAWKDFSPRGGVSYDVFGTGRTALKAYIGKIVGGSNSEIAGAVDPVVTSVNSVNRAWNDANGNFFPDCDLLNPGANGECGPYSNLAFGQQRITARWSDDVTKGFGARDYLWDAAVELQHQISDTVSVDVGWYRNWYKNFRVTDNLAVTPADYDPFCITAPVDSRLPGGGGYQVCGMSDLKPAKFGQVDQLVTQASQFGKQQRYSDFFGVNLTARFGGLRVAGGLDTGRTTLDQCFVVDSPQQLLQCRQVLGFEGNTQIKLNGSYELPFNFVVSAVYQNLSGPAIAANYAASNAEIAPSLGRNLAGRARTAVVPLIQPFTQYEPRRTQLDLRLSRRFQVGANRLRVSVDAYNAFNAASILGSNPTFGPAWRRPVAAGGTNSAVLDARLIQLSAELTF